MVAARMRSGALLRLQTSTSGRVYCTVPSFSFVGLKAAPKSNQTVQSQQCNPVASSGNHLTKSPFPAIWSLSHKLSIKLMAQHPPNSTPFPFSSFQHSSNSYSSSSGKGLHFSLPNPTILSMYMNQKNNSAEPSGLLSPVSSSIPALLTTRMSQLNRGPLIQLQQRGCSGNELTPTPAVSNSILRIPDLTEWLECPTVSQIN